MMAGLRDSLARYAEPAATIASSMIAEPAAGWAGVMSGGDPAAVERTRNALTYEPRTEEGQQGLRRVGQELEPIVQTLDATRSRLGDNVFNATGSPAAATAAYSLPDAVMNIGPLRLAKGLRGASLSNLNRAPMSAAGKQKGNVYLLSKTQEDPSNLSVLADTKGNVSIPAHGVNAKFMQGKPLVVPLTLRNIAARQIAGDPLTFGELLQMSKNDEILSNLSHKQASTRIAYANDLPDGYSGAYVPSDHTIYMNPFVRATTKGADKLINQMAVYENMLWHEGNHAIQMNHPGFPQLNALKKIDNPDIKKLHDLRSNKVFDAIASSSGLPRGLVESQNYYSSWPEMLAYDAGEQASRRMLGVAPPPRAGLRTLASEFAQQMADVLSQTKKYSPQELEAFAQEFHDRQLRGLQKVGLSRFGVVHPDPVYGQTLMDEFLRAP